MQDSPKKRYPKRTDRLSWCGLEDVHWTWGMRWIGWSLFKGIPCDYPVNRLGL